MGAAGGGLNIYPRRKRAVFRIFTRLTSDGY